MECKNGTNWVKFCTTVGEKKLDGGHPRKMWWDFIKDDVKGFGLL